MSFSFCPFVRSPFWFGVSKRCAHPPSLLSLTCPLSVLSPSPLSPFTAWAVRAHALALSALVLTTAHVQVATRLLALGAPGWVWCAAAGAAAGPKAWLPPRALWAYAVGYAAVGGLLHALWFPWT